MDWTKHGFGPGTNVCARCKETKEPARYGSKWCASCDAAMGRGEGPLPSGRGPRKVRRTRIVR